MLRLEPRNGRGDLDRGCAAREKGLQFDALRVIGNIEAQGRPDGVEQDHHGEQQPGAPQRPVVAHELEPFTWRLIRAYQARGPSALDGARATFQRFSHSYRAAFADCDVLLTPTLTEEPWSLGHLSPLVDYDELMARTARAVGYTPIHNISGCPGMSVPLHWSARELPIGVHFAADLGRERTLLELAYELEAARPWRDRWAPFSYPRMLAG